MSEMSSPQLQDSRLPWGLLKSADQVAMGILAMAALVLLAAWWYVQGGWHGRLVEFDQQPARPPEFLVDINTADWPELAQLPGIGEMLARRIVESRRTHGPYLSHQDLRRVRGIGPATLERLRPHLRPLPDAGRLAGP
ncbi:MAG: helix-hairpin-helix domain-containing protein [Pirellulales bacterium]|nr:helix-hairpin-helix domain-containing protein [Pirellulales bacterium]